MEFREFIASIGEPAALEKAHLGFFSTPVLATAGVYAGRVVKIYPRLRKKSLAEALEANHRQYLPMLGEAGIRLPATELLLMKDRGAYVPVIIQERFAREELVRGILEKGDAETCAGLVIRMQRDALDFLEWRRKRGFHHRDIGFHPTTRNYALREGELYYFDTFPPMACSQPVLNRWIPYLSPYRAARWLAPFISGQMQRVTTEYYLAEPMLYGLAGSACRLRPELAREILSASAAFLQQQQGRNLFAKELPALLERPPRLGKLWTSVRKMLGKEGKPDI